MAKGNKTVAGIGFPGLLAIAFIVLKLTKVVAWSWWWVLAPLWAPLVIIFLASIIAAFVAVLKEKK